LLSCRCSVAFPSAVIIIFFIPRRPAPTLVTLVTVTIDVIDIFLKARRGARGSELDANKEKETQKNFGASQWMQRH